RNSILEYRFAPDQNHEPGRFRIQELFVNSVTVGQRSLQILSPYRATHTHTHTHTHKCTQTHTHKHMYSVLTHSTWSTAHIHDALPYIPSSLYRSVGIELIQLIFPLRVWLVPRS